MNWPPGLPDAASVSVDERFNPGAAVTVKLLLVPEWEAFAYWCRPALEAGAPLPDIVASELQCRCPGFVEFNESARDEDHLIQQDWHRLMVWVADHFFIEAKREGWFDAILISVRNHPRGIRTLEYWEYCDDRWASALPVPYPSFEYWRHNADRYVDLGAD